MEWLLVIEKWHEVMIESLLVSMERLLAIEERHKIIIESLLVSMERLYKLVNSFYVASHL